MAEKKITWEYLKELYKKHGFTPTRRMTVHSIEKKCCPLYIMFMDEGREYTHRLEIVISYLSKTKKFSEDYLYEFVVGWDGFSPNSEANKGTIDGMEAFIQWEKEKGQWV